MASPLKLKMYKPYSIRCPAFDVTSGGIRAVYGLYGALLMKGQIVFMNAKIDTNFIGIYPEIYHGNDMGATTVVRWVLQTPGIMANYGIPGPDTNEIKATSDHIYVFSKIYDTIGVADDHILFLPILNLHLFKNQKKKRTKTCFLIGKGINQNKHPDDAIELTRQFAFDQQALADLLNECSVLYCYDRLSAMMDIARLCGCRVQYYGDFSKDKLSLYETGMNGLGYRDEEIKLDTDEFRNHYKDMITIFNNRLDNFIENTQKKLLY